MVWDGYREIEIFPDADRLSEPMYLDPVVTQRTIEELEKWCRENKIAKIRSIEESMRHRID